MSTEFDPKHRTAPKSDLAFDKLRAMNERLVEDNHKYDDKIRKASTIIDSISTENRKLKTLVSRRDDAIDELKRQNRELEDSLLKLRGDLRDKNKFKAIETRLRKELEGLTAEKGDLEFTVEDLKKTHKNEIEDFKREIRHEKLQRESLMNDISKIADEEHKNDSLMEQYFEELRASETHNEKLENENTKLRDERNEMIAKHNNEIREIQQKAKSAMERFKDAARKPGPMGANSQSHLHSSSSFQGPQPLREANWENRYRLVSEVAADNMKTLEQFNKLLKEVSISENTKVELYKDKMKDQYEKGQLVFSGDAVNNHFKKELDAFENKILECESVIVEQQKVIEALNQDNDNLRELYTQTLALLEHNSKQGVEKEASLLEQMDSIIENRKREYESIATQAARRFDDLKSKLKEAESENREIITLIQSEIDDVAPEETSGGSGGAHDIKIVEVLKKGFEKRKCNEQELYQSIRQEGLQTVQVQAQENERLLREVESYKERISHLQEELEEKTSELIEITAVFECKLHESEQDSEQITLLNEKVFSLESEIEKYEKKLSDVSSENSELITKYEDLVCKNLESESMQHDQQEINELTFENKGLQNRVKALELQLREQAFEAQNMQEELNYRQERMVQLSAQKKNVQMSEQKLHHQLSMLQDENINLKHSNLNSTNLSKHIEHDASIHNLSKPSLQTHTMSYHASFVSPADHLDDVDVGGLDLDDDDDDLNEFEKNLLEGNLDI